MRYSPRLIRIISKSYPNIKNSLALRDSVPRFKWAIAALCLTLFMFIAPLSFAVTTVRGEPIENPSLASEVVFEVKQTGKISVANGKLQWAEINLTIPQENDEQDVTRVGGTVITDKLGNQLLKIRQDNPPNEIIYTTSTEVLVRKKSVDSLPATYSIPPDARLFLNPTEHIQSNDSDIISLARQITANSSSDFEKVGKLAFWVNDLLTYDIGIAGATKDAIWVLNNKRGVCAEYSTLFAALARAAGIPTRYTYVYAYGENGWESHAIDEVYIGKWVMVDPLWLQAGLVDAAHVKYTIQPDNQIINSVLVLGNNVRDITWAEDVYEFDTKSVKYDSRLKDNTLFSSATKLEPGDQFVVYSELTSPDYRIEELTLQPCGGTPQIAMIEDKRARLIMTPNKKKVAVWRGVINPDISRQFTWTCPLTLNSRYWENKVLNLTVSTEYDSELAVAPRLAKPSLNFGETQTVFIDLVRKRGSGDVEVGFISGDKMGKKVLSFGGQTSASFDWVPESLGSQDVLVFTSAGDVKKISFDVKQAGDVFIKSIELPTNVTIGQNVTAKVTVQSNRATEQQVRLDFNGDIRQIAVAGERVFEFPLDTSRIGKQGVTVKISGADFSDERYSEVQVLGPRGELTEEEARPLTSKIFDAIASFFQKIWRAILSLFGRA